MQFLPPSNTTEYVVCVAPSYFEFPAITCWPEPYDELNRVNS